jgi:hypothetical protein
MNPTKQDLDLEFKIQNSPEGQGLLITNMYQLEEKIEEFQKNPKDTENNFQQSQVLFNNSIELISTLQSL